MDQNVTFQVIHEKHTDVAHVDLASPIPGSVVDAVDVGDDLGFPGQIVARLDRNHNVLLGVSIQNFSSFKKELRLEYGISSPQRALRLLINSLRAGMHATRPAQLSA